MANTRAHSVFRLAFLTLGFSLALTPSRAEAFLSVAAGGGVSFGSGDAQPSYKSMSTYLTGEALVGFLPFLDTGIFYDHNFLSASNDIDSQGMEFYGVMAQVSLGLVTDLFADAKFGLTKRSALGAATYDSTFGYGLGVGYSLSLAPLVALKPHVGYRHLPAKVTGSSLDPISQNFWDFAVLLSIGF